MGMECIGAVNKALAGVDISGPWGPRGEMVRFNGNAYALLSAIAVRQPDTGWGGDPEPICIFRKRDLIAVTHMSADSVERARTFLIKAGVLSYWKSTRHMDVNGTGRLVSYRQVYRIDLQAVARYAPGWSLMDGRWITANSGSIAAISGESGQKAAICGSYDIRIRNKKKDPSSCGCVDDLSPEQREKVRALGDEVALACRVERRVVNDEVLYTATKGRRYGSLHAKIEECKTKLIPGCMRKIPQDRVAIMVKQLKMVLTSDKDPSVRREKADFEPPKPLSR